MKKIIISLLVLALIAFVIYWIWYKPKDTTENKEPVPLAITDKTDGFKSSFGELMTS